MKTLLRYFTLRKRIRNEITELENTIQLCNQNKYKHIGSKNYMDNITKIEGSEMAVKILKQLL